MSFFRKDAGTRRAVSSAVMVAIVAQHKAHPTWSYKLHADNLVALVALGELVGRVPSYTTVRRLMKERGLFRQKRRQRRGPEEINGHSREIFEARETRSFESEYVLALWHLDFHAAKVVRIVLASGACVTPKLLGILDDRSRLCCHAQWYLDETAETLVRRRGWRWNTTARGTRRSAKHRPSASCSRPETACALDDAVEEGGPVDASCTCGPPTGPAAEPDDAEARPPGVYERMYEYV